MKLGWAALALLVIMVGAGCARESDTATTIRDQELPQGGSWSISSATHFGVAAWSLGDVPVQGARGLTGLAPFPDCGEPVTWTWSSRAGASRFRVVGSQASVASDRPPAAGVALMRGQGTDETLPTWSFALVDPAGRTVREMRLLSPRVMVAWNKGSRALVLAYAGGNGRLLGLAGNRTFSLDFDSETPVATCQVSGDGRFAVVGQQEEEGHYLLSWIRVDWGLGFHVVARTRGMHPCATLSYDGSTAVLQGVRPRVVSFGGEAGKRLPIDYVSGAQVGEGRLMVRKCVAIDGKPRQRVKVIDETGDVLLDLRLGFMRRVHADPQLHYVAYVDDTSRRGVVIEVDSGRQVSLDGYDDIFPVSATELAVVSSSGVLGYCRNPLGRR